MTNQDSYRNSRKLFFTCGGRNFLNIYIYVRWRTVCRGKKKDSAASVTIYLLAI